jgi:twitching motility protein PilU
MRQAPDCILIGEIRDKDTMAAAIAYAQTGHLCLATLHANNSYHALNRIINFFPLESRTSLYLDLSVTLKAIISQRLVKLPDGTRAPAAEILLNTRHIAELIEKGEINAIKEAMEQTMAPGSQTFEQDLFNLYKSGRITLDEALANADSPTNLSWLINNSEFGASSPDTRAVTAAKAAKAAPLAFEPQAVAATESPEEGASFTEFTITLKD